MRPSQTTMPSCPPPRRWIGILCGAGILVTLALPWGVSPNLHETAHVQRRDAAVRAVWAPQFWNALREDAAGAVVAQCLAALWMAGALAVAAAAALRPRSRGAVYAVVGLLGLAHALVAVAAAGDGLVFWLQGAAQPLGAHDFEPAAANGLQPLFVGAMLLIGLAGRTVATTRTPLRRMALGACAAAVAGAAVWLTVRWLAWMRQDAAAEAVAGEAAKVALAWEIAGLIPRAALLLAAAGLLALAARPARMTRMACGASFAAALVLWLLSRAGQNVLTMRMFLAGPAQRLDAALAAAHGTWILAITVLLIVLAREAAGLLCTAGEASSAGAEPVDSKA